jgi:hypothetical protein
MTCNVVLSMAVGQVCEDLMTFWDTPKGVLLAAALAAVVGAMLGFKIGQAPQAPTVIVLKWISK